MSEETTAFVAEIYVDGVNVGHAKNDGHGGSTDYYAYPEKRQLLAEAEKLCLALPPKVYPASHGMNEFSVPMNLEVFIDSIVDDELKNKDIKKFEKKKTKLMETAIVLGVPNGDSYSSMNFKRPLNTVPLAYLQTQVDNCKRQLKAGEQILNTNLTKLGITI